MFCYDKLTPASILPQSIPGSSILLRLMTSSEPTWPSALPTVFNSRTSKSFSVTSALRRKKRSIFPHPGVSRPVLSFTCHRRSLAALAGVNLEVPYIKNNQ
jgi:hypothetical protein